MRRIQILRFAAVVVALVATASFVQAKEGGKKHHHGGIRGVVTSIETDAAKGRTITITTGGKKNKKTGETTPTETKVFKLTDATTFAKVSHKAGVAKGEKGAAETTPATFADLKDGEHVSIQANNDTATTVNIHSGHHKKKAA